MKSIREGNTTTELLRDNILNSANSFSLHLEEGLAYPQTGRSVIYRRGDRYRTHPQANQNEDEYPSHEWRNKQNTWPPAMSMTATWPWRAASIPIFQYLSASSSGIFSKLAIQKCQKRKRDHASFKGSKTMSPLGALASSMVVSQIENKRGKSIFSS